MNEEDIDKVICDWSFRSGHTFTPEEIDSLVVDICDWIEQEFETIKSH